MLKPNMHSQSLIAFILNVRCPSCTRDIKAHNRALNDGKLPVTAFTRVERESVCILSTLALIWPFNAWKGD